MMSLGVLEEAWVSVLWKACWQGGVVVLAVALICRTMPSLPARAQGWLWRLALLKFAVVLLLPTLVNLPWLPSCPATAMVSGSQVALGPTGNPGDEANLSGAKASVIPSALCVLWTIGFLWSSGRLWAAWWESKRLRRTGSCCCRRPVLEDLAVQCRLFRLRTVPQLLVRPGNGSPLLIGVFRPAIVLPVETLDRLSAHELALVLGHEVAHIRRGDLTWSFIAAAIRAVFFFHPLVWMGQRRLSLAQEIAADGLAIARQSHDPLSYGKLLVSIVGKLGSVQRIPTMSMGTTGPLQSLTRRLVAMSLQRNASLRNRVLSLCVVASVVALGLLPWRLVAAEPKGSQESQASVAKKASPDPVRYVAKIKFLQVAQEGEQKTTVDTELRGTQGTPLKASIGGTNGVTVSLEVQDVPKSRPSQYLAAFRIVERHGDEESVLAAPKICILAEHSGMIMTDKAPPLPDREKGDRIELKFVVTEQPGQSPEK